MNSELKSVIKQTNQKINSLKNEIVNTLCTSTGTDGVWSADLLCKIINSLTFCTQKMSHTLSKMTILLSERPLPSSTEMTSLYTDLIKEGTQLVLLLKNMFSCHCGQTLKQMYKLSSIDIVDAVIDVLNEMESDIYNKEKILKTTGCVWECENQFKALPRNMLQLFLDKCQTEHATLVDAEEELKNEIKDQESSKFGLDNESWTEEDVKLLSPATGLIKTSYSLCKKVKECAYKKETIESTDQVNQIDELCMKIQSVSSLVDDLVTNLYPPLTKEFVFTSTNSLANDLISILHLFESSFFVQETDKQWIEFLRKAVKHNSTKLLGLLKYPDDFSSKLKDLEISNHT